MRVLVTAGPTREAIDDVRFLSNASTGRMGFAVARAARDAGHETTLVTGPVALPPPRGVATVPVVSALEMRDAVRTVFPDSDAVVMTAAVADYRPAERVRGKRKKTEGRWTLTLVRNPDILAELGPRKGERVLVGFALEAEDGERNARKKLAAKNLDFVVLDSPETVGAEESDFLVLARDGRRIPYMSVSKDFLAQRLVSLVTEAMLGREGREGG